MLKPKIRVKLAELELSNNKLANDFNTSPQRISNWVRGHSFPNLNEAFKLANYLGCKVDDLWEYKED